MLKINYKKINSLDFNDFKYFESIKDFPKDKYLEILNIKYNCDNPPYPYLIQEHLIYEKDKSYKIAEIEINNDFVYILFKIVNIMSTKLIKIFDTPISVSRNKENEKLIIDELLKLEFVTFKFKETFKEYFTKYNYKYEDDDFYRCFNDYKEKLTPRYLNRKHITFSMDYLDVKVQTSAPEQLENLLIEFGKYKNKSYKHLKFYKYLNSKNSNQLFLNIYYKDLLLSCSVFDIFNDCLINQYEISISRNKINVSDNILKKIFSHFEDIVYYNQYKLFSNDYKRVYYGSGGRSEGLKNHKEQHSDGKIKYYRIEKERFNENN